MKYSHLTEHVKYIRETLRALRDSFETRTFKFIGVVLLLIFGAILLLFPSLFTAFFIMSLFMIYMLFGFGCALFMIDHIQDFIKNDFLVLVLYILIMLLWPLFLLFAYGLTTYHKLA